MTDVLRHAFDPVCWARERLGFVADPWQEQALRTESKRVIFLCARQSGKSTTSALRALHTAIYSPGSLVLLLSPSLRQSSELQRKVDLLAAALPELEYIEHSKLSMTLANGSRIISLPGHEETVRGFSSVTLLVEDEAAQVSDSFYKVIRPMLAVSGGGILLMSTPHGMRGHFHHEWSDGGPGWERIEVKASQCPRISKVFLDEERLVLGPRWYAQEYECQFVEAEGSVFDPVLVNAAFRDVPPLFGDVVDKKVRPLAVGGRR
jgi:hypothetical protein